MSVVALAERAVAPLDWLRRQLLRAAVALPRLTPLVLRRERRVPLIAVGHAVLAFALVASFPALLFILAPVLLGVVHVAADVRYLVLRRKLPSWWRKAIWGGCATLIAVRVVAELGGNFRTTLQVEQLLACVWMALALAAGALARGHVGRALLATPVVAAIAYASWAQPIMTRVVFIHLHNVVAVGVWLLLFRRSLRAAVAPLLVIGGLTLLLLSAETASVAESVGGLSAFGMHLYYAAEWIAPGLPPRTALGLTLAYIFLQSVHYSAGLLLIPQEDMRRESSLPFRGSLKSLLDDFGVWVLLAIGVAGLVVLIGAIIEVHRARSLYLSLAMFHGYLELSLLAYFFSRGPATRRRTRRRSFDEAVPNPAHGFDVVARASELLPQPFHMGIDRSRTDAAVHAPNGVEQSAARLHSILALVQRHQQLELEGGQLHLGRLDPNAVSLAVYPQAAELDDSTWHCAAVAPP